MQSLFTWRNPIQQSPADTKTKLDQANLEKQLHLDAEAVDRAYATISFTPDGKILNANQLFLQTLSYTLSEIRGQHHSIFVDTAEVATPAYRQFWEALRSGESQSGEFCRITKQRREIWINASYIPVLDEHGSVIRVIKYATDITQQKLRDFERQSKLAAISRSQAEIEFDLDGTIRSANENFLLTLGYRLQDIVGKHHSMFVQKTERESAEYRAFWKALAAGQFQADRFLRIAADGREIWIQATYNPMFDSKGVPFRVVKFATDVTEQVMAQRRRAAEVGNAVANSTNEMVETINEISKNVSHTASLASTTEALTAETSRNVHQLTESSRAIEQVVEVIEELADQTNLLALNAKIESARAGEAGRGFAVVADEVKDLANQTANATKNIEKSIRDIQSQIKAFVSSTENITKSVAEVSVNMTTISSAVEEQSVTMDCLRATTDQLRTNV